MRSMRVVKRTRKKERERERKRERERENAASRARERERERTKKDARAARELRTSERARGGGGEKRNRLVSHSLFSTFFSFFFSFAFRVIFFVNKNTKTTFLRATTHERKKEKHSTRRVMDESWEELKRNAILLGSWIALIRASTYIFGAFQKAD